MSRNILTFARSVIYGATRLRPSLLIIGAQKAGTTSLYQYLIQHPEVAANLTWKEAHFFDNPTSMLEGPGRYWSCFPSAIATRKKKTLECTPEYLYYPHCIKSISAMLPEAKIVIVLREPSSRALSAWRMYSSFKNNKHKHLQSLYDPRPFSQAIQEELQHQVANAGYPHHYIDRGRYASQVARYQEEFGRDRILILESQAMRKDLRKTLGCVTKFWGISSYDSQHVEELAKQRYNTKPETASNDGSSEIEESLHDLRLHFDWHNKRLFKIIDKSFSHWCD